MKSTLTAFYFGSLPEIDRLAIEKQMLCDPEVLLDYLDLKREMEAAELIPSVPSNNLRSRLLSRLAVSKRVRYTLVLGLALAAIAVLIFFCNHLRTEADGTLFDSGGEQFSHSNVL